MDAQQARQLKIKCGALTRTMKDHASYNNEKSAQEAKVEAVRAAQAALPDEEKDPNAVNRAQAELAETAAVIPTIVVKIETYLGDLEGVMATIEDAQGDNMEAIKETDEWKAA